MVDNSKEHLVDIIEIMYSVDTINFDD